MRLKSWIDWAILLVCLVCGWAVMRANGGG